MVKNLPAIQETWVQSLGWEDSLEKGMVTHYIIQKYVAKDFLEYTLLYMKTAGMSVSTAANPTFH